MTNLFCFSCRLLPKFCFCLVFFSFLLFESFFCRLLILFYSSLYNLDWIIYFSSLSKSCCGQNFSFGRRSSLLKVTVGAVKEWMSRSLTKKYELNVKIDKKREPEFPAPVFSIVYSDDVKAASSFFRKASFFGPSTKACSTTSVMFDTGMISTTSL